MNNQTLVIYDFEILYEILKELESHVNFNLLCIKKKSSYLRVSLFLRIIVIS